MLKNKIIIGLGALFSVLGCSDNSKNAEINTITTADSNLNIDTKKEALSDSISVGSNLSSYDQGQERLVRQGFERAAQAFMESYRDERFLEFVQFMHPAVVKVYGGKAAFIAQIKDSKKQDKQRYRRWEAGTLEAFTAVRDDRGRVTGWYAVVPIKRWLEGSKDSEYQLQWLGGQSLDGKQFHFIDITDGDKGMIYRIMPDMRFLLENLEESQVPQS